MGRRRKRQSGLRKIIRSLYKVLGVANTGAHILEGNPGKLAKHIARRQSSKWGSRIIR